ncbi:Histidine kinase, Hpt-family and CheW domain-containing [Desulfonema limicola]|uniref:histidine kinase n=1 Tax=Desulfonema limicola TaxID=45656 RepID=A0A975GI99_9BACT|nr:chemotaxis protein CheA [Desulfonema limicola]QTA81688.1 Histidine kinase, Hpt-family and CheW domain-containing [Desulfonema limicola]
MDFDESIFEEFVLEAREGLETAEESLSQLLEKEQDPDPELLDQIFRAVHSIKGAAGFLMLKRMEELAKSMESLMSMIREKTLKLDSETGDVLTEGIDMLMLMLENITQSDEIDISMVMELINNISSSSDIDEKSGYEEQNYEQYESAQKDFQFEISPITLKNLPVMHEFLYILNYELVSHFSDKEDDPADLIKNLLSVGIIIDSELRTSEQNLEQTPQGPLWFTVLYSTILDPDFIDDAVYLPSDRIFPINRDELGDADAVTFNVISKKISLISLDNESTIEQPDQKDQAEQSFPLKDVVQTQQTHLPEISEPENIAHQKTQDSYDNDPDDNRHKHKEIFLQDEAEKELQLRHDFHADMENLDLLINLVGELVIAESMVTKNPDLKGLRLDNFERSSHNLKRIISELQSVVMSARMISLARVFNRLGRLVRDLSMKSNKKIYLKVIGQETEVDKNIIVQIAEPLEHIITNCVQHGIETPEQRLSLDKPETGTITLEARKEGTEILIYISDDGRGFDRNIIIAQAVKQGLASEDDDSQLSYEEACQLVFKTSESITKPESEKQSFPGMAMLKSRMDILKGRIHIQSVPNKGTTTVLRIPLTMGIIDGMIIRVGKASYTIPLLSIRESFRPDPSQITITMGGQEMVKVRDRLIPVIRLHKLYDIESDWEALDQGILINAASGSKNICFFADEIIGHHQTVIKSMPEYIGSIFGISGCTIMDNGNIGLILDVADIIDMLETHNNFQK